MKLLCATVFVFALLGVSLAAFPTTQQLYGHWVGSCWKYGAQYGNTYQCTPSAVNYYAYIVYRDDSWHSWYNAPSSLYWNGQVTANETGRAVTLKYTYSADTGDVKRENNYCYHVDYDAKTGALTEYGHKGLNVPDSTQCLTSDQYNKAPSCYADYYVYVCKYWKINYPPPQEYEEEQPPYTPPY
jgi:hypothetical protein